MASSNIKYKIPITVYKTLTADVLTTAKTLPQGITIFAVSNNPSSQPTGCSWGCYVFIKIQDLCAILYMDMAHIAGTYGIENSTESITWHIV